MNIVNATGCHVFRLLLLLFLDLMQAWVPSRGSSWDCSRTSASLQTNQQQQQQQLMLTLFSRPLLRLPLCQLALMLLMALAAAATAAAAAAAVRKQMMRSHMSRRTGGPHDVLQLLLQAAVYNRLVEASSSS
jgi:hypothetical protein